MKRDMDLVREILINVEQIVPARGTRYFRPDESPFVEVADKDVLLAHLDLLIKAGLLEGDIIQYADGTASYRIDGMTWSGHDFLENVRDKTAWEKTKRTARKAGSFSMDVIVAIAKEVAIGAARDLLGPGS